MQCLVCNLECNNKRSFASHLQRSHKMKSQEYTIAHIYNGLQPSCATCSEITRYSSFTYKKYCVKHSSYAESEAGSIGGKASAWNKGLTKETDERVAKAAENLTGNKNPFFGKHHSEETINKIKITKLLSRSDFAERIQARNTEFKLLSSYEDYFSRQSQYLEFECLKCGYVLKRTLQTFERGTTCDKCFSNNTSKPEREISSYIEGLGFVVSLNAKNVITPKELDIFISEKNVAIEYNGLYWHANEKKAHKMKRDLCNDKNIQLIQIFSDEWTFNQDICKSMIAHKLGITNNRIYARNCTIAQLDKKNEKQFFESTHISGFTSSKIAFGLFDNSNNLVAALSLRVPRHKKYKNMIEIGRFSCSLNTAIIGGFSKLLKHVISWCKENNFTKIISYADLRFSNGNVYTKNGFQFIRFTGLNYWYTDYKQRYDRFKFRAKDGLTENQVAVKHNVVKIFGCGNNLYELDV